MKGKKILSLVLSLVLLVSMIGVMPAKAAETYSGSLTLKGREHMGNTAVMVADDALYLAGAEGLAGVTITGNWDVAFTAVENNESGIFLDGKKVASNIKNYGSSYWFANGWGTGVIKPGQSIVIKGDFVYNGITVKITESTFVWDGIRFAMKKDEPNMAGIDMKVASDGGTANGIYVDTYLKGELKNDGSTVTGWGTGSFANYTAYSETVVNGNYTSGELKKLGDTRYYIDFKSTVSAGGVVIVRGQFIGKDSNGDDYIVDFNEHQFTWDGSSWTCKKVLASGELQVAGKQPDAPNTNPSVIYAKGDSTLDAAYKLTTEGSWDEKLVGKTSADGVFLNHNTRVDNESNQLVKYSNANNYWFIEGFTATTAGEQVTVKGDFVLKSNSAEIINIKETTFEWTGSVWEKVFDEGTLSLTGAETSAAEGTQSTSSQFIYLKGDAVLDEYKIGSNDNWDNYLYGIGDGSILLDGEPIENATIFKYNDKDNYWFVKNFGAAQDGQVLTIKGNFGLANDGNAVNFKEVSFQWKDGKWSEYVGYTYNDVTITGLQSDTALNGGSTAWFIYTNAEGTIPGDGWKTVFNNVKVFVGDNDITGNVTVKYAGGTTLFFEIPTTLLSAIPTVGTRVTIKAGEYTGSSFADGVGITGDLGEGIRITTDYVMEWNGTEWGKPDYTVYTDFAVSDLGVATAKKDNQWFAYFGTTAELPGGVWGKVDGTEEKYQINMSVNDGEIFSVTVKKSGPQELFMEIPYTYLPTDAEAKVTIKAGKYKSNVQEIGYNITADYTFYTTPISWSEEKLSVTTESPQFRLDAAHVNTKMVSFVLYTKTDDGMQYDGGWGPNCELKPIPASQTYDSEKGILWLSQTKGYGLYKNGQYTNAYSALKMKKVSGTEYYINVSEAGAPVQNAGDYYQIKGYFYDANNKIVYYETGYATWNGSTWEASADSLQDTNVDADINADGIVNSVDLIRMLLQKDNPMISINEARVDINYDGNVDTYDVSVLRKVIVGQLYYMNGSSVPYGTPAVNNSKRIEKLAYACPVIGTWAGDKFYSEFKSYSDAEIDAIFQEYKATGLTLLNTEFVAHLTTAAVDAYNNDALRAYLNGAQRNGLGVIVRCDYLEFLLKASDLEGTYKDWQGVMDHYVNYLSKWSSFKGFMMSDELGTTYASNYVAVAGYLHEKYPNLILFSSELPNYAEGLTGESAYKDYVNTFGTASGYFTYDNYGLRSSDPRVGDITYEVENTWYTNLKWVAENSLNSDGTQKYIPGVTIQAFSMPAGSSWWNTYEKYAPEQAEDIGFQVYTSLAWGMQSINYFSYENHYDDSNVNNEIQVNDAVRAAVASVNAEIDKFGDVYKGFTWKKTIDLQNTTNSSTGNSRLASAKVSGARTLIGCMKDADGFDGYMIANAAGPRTSTAANVTLTFNNATKAIAYIDGEKTTVNLTNGAYTFNVGVGEGIFVIPIR